MRMVESPPQLLRTRHKLTRENFHHPATDSKRTRICAGPLPLLASLASGPLCLASLETSVESTTGRAAACRCASRHAACGRLPAQPHEPTPRGQPRTAPGRYLIAPHGRSPHCQHLTTPLVDSSQVARRHLTAPWRRRPPSTAGRGRHGCGSGRSRAESQA